MTVDEAVKLAVKFSTDADTTKKNSRQAITTAIRNVYAVVCTAIVQFDLKSGKSAGNSGSFQAMLQAQGMSKGTAKRFWDNSIALVAGKKSEVAGKKEFVEAAKSGWESLAKYFDESKHLGTHASFKLAAFGTPSDQQRFKNLIAMWQRQAAEWTDEQKAAAIKAIREAKPAEETEEEPEQATAGNKPRRGRPARGENRAAA
jgi:hypothetical protein